MKKTVWLASLLLAACGEARTAHSNSEIQSIAHDEAVDANGGQISSLETKVADLQTNLQAANNEINELRAETGALQSSTRQLEYHDKEVRDHLKM